MVARRLKLRFRDLPENRAAIKAALMINVTAWVMTSKFLFIRPFKPLPWHVHTLFVGKIVAQNGRNCDGEVQGGKCLYFNRTDQMS